MEFKFLDFEQPIAELEAKIDELRFVSNDPSTKLNQEISHLKNSNGKSTQNSQGFPMEQ